LGMLIHSRDRLGKIIKSLGINMMCF
jgi:hypothetical protein